MVNQSPSASHASCLSLTGWRVPLGCANRCEGCRRGWRCRHRPRGDRSYHIIVSHSERGLLAKTGLSPDISGVFILFL